MLTADAVQTAVGTLTLLARDDKLVASGFDVSADDLAHQYWPGATVAAAARRTPAATLVEAYFDGDLGALDRIVVDQDGPPFRRQVWDALRRIPPGVPATYGELAMLAGRPNAARAAGTACASNRIAVVIPCHRAVRAGGATGNYLWAPDRKRWLLDHEAKFAG